MSLTGKNSNGPDEMGRSPGQTDAGQIPKRAEAVEQQSRRKGGRPQIRWEEYIKRDVRKVEGGKLPIGSSGKRQLKQCRSTRTSQLHPVINGTTWKNILPKWQT